MTSAQNQQRGNAIDTESGRAVDNQYSFVWTIDPELSPTSNKFTTIFWILPFGHQKSLRALQIGGGGGRAATMNMYIFVWIRVICKENTPN